MSSLCPLSMFVLLKGSYLPILQTYTQESQRFVQWLNSISFVGEGEGEGEGEG